MAQSKQHADLIRHRELNALRRLMTLRQPLHPRHPLATAHPTLAQAHTAQATAQIDALEAQMERQISASAKPSVLLSQFAASNQATSTIGSAEAVKTHSVVTEAALLFANNQINTAQNLLERAIRDPSTYSHIPTWLALFDLYRATGQITPFESLCLDFSFRFGRSTPSWVAIGQAPPLATLAPSTQHLHWSAPSRLSELALHNLTTAIDTAILARQTLILEWGALQAISPEHCIALRTCLTRLAESPLRCAAYGVPVLMRLLQTAEQAASLALLTLLRCFNQAQAFEDLALSYCEIFEISPPDWQPPQCTMLSSVDATAPHNASANSHPALEQSITTPHAALPLLELTGHLETDLPPVFATYLQASATQVPCSITCDQLVRCAPTAAQKLLGWLQTARARHIRIEFSGVHRLVAAYWLSQGLYEYAKVNLRKD